VFLGNDIFALDIRGTDAIKNTSIVSGNDTGTVEEKINGLAYRIFGVIKIII
jgi:hypothetical protein